MSYQKYIIDNIHKIILPFLFAIISCASLAAGSNSDSSATKIVSKSSYYYDALKLIEKKEFKLAIQSLDKAKQSSKNDPDIYNYLGFSYRKIGEMTSASFNYKKALKIDPKHKGALEYQGEMFITLGQLDKARVNLKKLEKICFLVCEEEKTLKQSIINSQNGKKNEY